ncbi:phospholipase A and acyltransferase 3-like isoform X2 [Eublepharis macularius]|uniref:Phospholipase A and acyltransferase 3-like isoform X2 n=1 Tax=Eublepharis macularius TaxID=481883 RepID=A0AA97JSN7_EUBMA|nr:phospholipase A and acyltransferase 3-like isoform X2 [Eublepharis macularius]
MSDYYVEPKPGDLIEISRFGYKHWAVYVGSGYVIHLAPTTVQASVSSIMSVLSEKAVVKKELLWEIARSDACQINNKYDQKYNPLPASKIVQEAESMLGKEVSYRVASQNCEHFVTRLRYGTARSDQVKETVASAVGLIGVGVVLGLATVLGSLFLPNKHEEE